MKKWHKIVALLNCTRYSPIWKVNSSQAAQTWDSSCRWNCQLWSPGPWSRVELYASEDVPTNIGNHNPEINTVIR
jgi:hypothetical protein